MHASSSALECTLTQINIKISHVVEAPVISWAHKMKNGKQL